MTAPRVVPFLTAYSRNFGEESATGSAAPASAYQLPGLVGQALNVIFTQDVEGELDIATGFLGTDAVQFATTQHMVDLANRTFPNPTGAQVNIINRLTRLRDNAGPDAWFPFFSFSTMNQANAYPKQGRPLVVGQTFFVHCIDSEGNTVIIEAVFQIPVRPATLSRTRTRPELFYLTQRG